MVFIFDEVVLLVMTFQRTMDGEESRLGYIETMKVAKGESDIIKQVEDLLFDRLWSFLATSCPNQ